MAGDVVMGPFGQDAGDGGDQDKGEHRQGYHDKMVGIGKHRPAVIGSRGLAA